MPNFTKLKYIRGIRDAHGMRAEATAEFLEKVQLTNEVDIPDRMDPAKVVQQDLGMNTEETKDNELDEAIKLRLAMEGFLLQGDSESFSFEQSQQLLMGVMGV